MIMIMFPPRTHLLAPFLLRKEGEIFHLLTAYFLLLTFIFFPDGLGGKFNSRYQPSSDLFPLQRTSLLSFQSSRYSRK